MSLHYRNYKVLVNGKPLPFIHSVEAIADSYIEQSKQDLINQQTKLGRIKKNDKVKFIFMFCNT